MDVDILFQLRYTRNDNEATICYLHRSCELLFGINVQILEIIIESLKYGENPKIG